jgi:hypothetical protein
MSLARSSTWIVVALTGVPANAIGLAKVLAFIYN